MLGIHLGLHGEETVNKLFLTHFQTEYSHAVPGMERHILGNIQDKSSLSHGRPGGNQHQIRGLHACGPVIQINESGGNSGDASAVMGRLFYFIHGVHDNLTDWNEISGIPALDQIKYLFLRFLHDNFHAVFSGIAVIGYLFHKPDQSAQH